MGWQTESVIQLFAGNTIINPNGIFVYSSAPAAGNLIASNAPLSGTDAFGNHYLQGDSAYGSGFATSLNGGFVTLYSGSLSGGWTSQATLTLSSGVLFLTAASGINLADATVVGSTLEVQGVLTADSNVVVSGTLSVGGSTSTQGPSNNSTSTNGLTNGQIAGTSGAASAGTAHTHGAGSFAVTNGQHAHTLSGHTHVL